MIRGLSSACVQVLCIQKGKCDCRNRLLVSLVCMPVHLCLVDCFLQTGRVICWSTIAKWVVMSQIVLACSCSEFLPLVLHTGSTPAECIVLHPSKTVAAPGDPLRNHTWIHCYVTHVVTTWLFTMLLLLYLQVLPAAAETCRINTHCNTAPIDAGSATSAGCCTGWLDSMCEVGHALNVKIWFPLPCSVHWTNRFDSPSCRVL